MNKTAVVTGAGSGVGQSTVIALAREGWKVALLGRRESALAETVAAAGGESENLLACRCDIGEAA